MKALEERILADGKLRCGTDVLKVDSFLNHQVDPRLLAEMGREIARIYNGEGITKILTIESSGIAIAAFAAMEMDVPFIFAKKHNARNFDDNVYSAQVYSFTKMVTYTIKVSKDYILPGDKVLIVDDFLANGKALEGLISITESAGAKVVGCAIAIEKAYQPGGARIRSLGYRVESLASIKKIEDGKIIF